MPDMPTNDELGVAFEILTRACEASGGMIISEFQAFNEETGDMIASYHLNIHTSQACGQDSHIASAVDKATLQ